MTQPLTERLRELLAKCTPGPWLVNPAKAWVEVPGKDAPICALLWPTDLRSEGETFANARLTAVAPDMAQRIIALEATQAELVEALKAARNVLHDALMPDGIYAEDAEPVLEKINAALAKLESSQ